MYSFETIENLADLDRLLNRIAKFQSLFSYKERISSQTYNHLVKAADHIASEIYRREYQREI